VPVAITGSAAQGFSPKHFITLALQPSTAHAYPRGTVQYNQ